MIYRDTVHISRPTQGQYGQVVDSARHAVAAIVSQTGGLRRGGMFDALAGDATAYLDPSDAWLKSIGYQLEGCVVNSTKHGLEREYKIVNVAIGERFATDGSVSHVEVELEEVKT